MALKVKGLKNFHEIWKLVFIIDIFVFESYTNKHLTTNTSWSSFDRTQEKESLIQPWSLRLF